MRCYNIHTETETHTQVQKHKEGKKNIGKLEKGSEKYYSEMMLTFRV